MCWGGDRGVTSLCGRLFVIATRLGDTRLVTRTGKSVIGRMVSPIDVILLGGRSTVSRAMRSVVVSVMVCHGVSRTVRSTISRRTRAWLCL